MRIQAKDGWADEFEGEVSAFVENELYRNPDGGKAEEAAESAEAAQEAISRLCNVLADKGVLTAKEVFVIAKGYEGNAKFVET